MTVFPEEIASKMAKFGDDLDARFYAVGKRISAFSDLADSLSKLSQKSSDLEAAHVSLQDKIKEEIKNRLSSCKDIQDLRQDLTQGMAKVSEGLDLHAQEHRALQKSVSDLQSMHPCIMEGLSALRDSISSLIPLKKELADHQSSSASTRQDSDVRHISAERRLGSLEAVLRDHCIRLDDMASIDQGAARTQDKAFLMDYMRGHAQAIQEFIKSVEEKLSAKQQDLENSLASHISSDQHLGEKDFSAISQISRC